MYIKRQCVIAWQHVFTSQTLNKLFKHTQYRTVYLPHEQSMATVNKLLLQTDAGLRQTMPTFKQLLLPWPISHTKRRAQNSSVSQRVNPLFLSPKHKRRLFWGLNKFYGSAVFPTTTTHKQGNAEAANTLRFQTTSIIILCSV